MKNQLMITTATGAVLAMTIPVQADTYITLFGGLSKLDNQSATIYTNSGSFLSGTKYAYVGGNGGITTITNIIPATTGSDFAYIFRKYTRTAVTRWSQDLVNYGTTISADYDFDTGFVIGAAFGWELSNSPISIELEFAWRKHDGQADVMYNYSWTRAGSYTLFSNTKFAFWYTVIHAVTGPTTGTFVTKVPGPYGSGGGTLTSSVPFTSAGGSSLTNSHSGDIRSWAIMANAWWDLNPPGPWHPYVGGGVGYADVEFEAGPISASDSGLAYQAAFGFGWDINPDLRINAEYRYFTVPDIELTYMGEDLGLEYDVSEFIVGLRMSF